MGVNINRRQIIEDSSGSALEWGTPNTTDWISMSADDNIDLIHEENGALKITVWGDVSVTFDSPRHPCIHVTHYADCTVIEREAFFWLPVVRMVALDQTIHNYLVETTVWQQELIRLQEQPETTFWTRPDLFCQVMHQRLEELSVRQQEIEALIAEIQDEIRDEFESAEQSFLTLPSLG